ncbi:MerR family transcriptional regulator [Paenibacillus illinoisensis]|uniref:helix-turn-helix domain-containing protein n=1 Tax=Paenibacillus illinoisensis TaxID=59845 RepID=UPI0020411627|nr:MerR family transcriptional regulator [Paenibacillus illinoisensis]MCM3203631.1 MerR family transcriptional regulator [Paenibacillus illinoisensis]
MKKEITISELAKLMGVSVHQIRYFEEKGILLPSYIDENQYRMYGMNEIYRLAHILLLRKVGLSVRAIREWSKEGTPDDMQRLLVQSVSKLEAEIDRLRSLSDFIRKVLDENEHYGQEGTSFQVIQRDQLVLTTWFETHMESELDARMLVQEGDPLPELFEADIHYVYEGDDRVMLCTEVHDVKGDIALPAGEYLSYRFTVHGEEELEQYFSQFQAFADRRGLILHGSRILAEKSYLSLFTQESLYYEMFARIEHIGGNTVDRDGKR